MNRTLLLLCVGLSLLVGTSSQAQQRDPVLELYGAGVHDYYANRYGEAISKLTEVIESGTLDPRPYYFRGMAQWNLGNKEAAKADFATGAQIEAGDPAAALLINRSLMRIQGQPRLAIEQLRTAAKANALDRRSVERRERYERFQRDEQDVLLPRLRGEQIPPPRPAPPRPAPQPEVETDDDFAGPAGQPAPINPAEPKPEMKPDQPPAIANPEPATELPTETGKAPGRLGRLFGVILRPAADAVDGAANAAADAAAGLPIPGADSSKQGDLPPDGNFPPGEGPGFGPGPDFGPDAGEAPDEEAVPLPPGVGGALEGFEPGE